MSRPSGLASFKRAANATAKPVAPKYPQPYSLRLTYDERALLDRAAGKLPLSVYIRSRLFGDTISKRSFKHPPRRKRLPSYDQKALAQLLGALGQSRLASNMNQIAKAANMGALPVTDDLVAELSRACADIATMRSDLISALGITAKDGTSPFAKASED
ncbi:MAG: MobC family plasmid mobilization relaxosome protein [Robiginitomaculum sp.]|nr:MobC family plasmid mobilization relaxosome protein [Robiginitomaculum sp.]